MEPRQVGLSGCDKEWDSLALVVTAPALGDDFSHGKGAKAAPNWKVLSRGPGGSFTTKPAQTFADGSGFAFVTDPDTQLFLTPHPGSGLLGDLTGKMLTATFTITGTATAFTYFAEGEPRNDGLCGAPAPASVRLCFERTIDGPIRSHANGGQPRRRTP
jgi:hypothetical protein